MERSESVNADEDYDGPDIEEPLPAGPDVASPSNDQGPCLYLGPSGQRCNRRAVQGGFCARHQPGAAQALSLPQVSRRGVAVVSLLAVLWPVLADLVRELIRLLR